jgi:carboxypeptidase family protein
MIAWHDVVDLKGRPIAGAKLIADHFGETGTTSNADGTFQLRGVPHMKFQLRAEAPEHSDKSIIVHTEENSVRLTLDEVE